MDSARTTRKFPAYTLAQLEAAVEAGRGNDVMLEEIAARKAGASNAFMVPQLEGGNARPVVGRM